MTVLISIEGNIGSGKSTLINKLKEKYKELDENKILFLKEPVDEWIDIKDKNGKNMIECFYGDQEKYSFSFQMMAYISRLSLLKNALKKNPDVIITERTLFTDRYVFAKLLRDNNKISIENYTIYIKWFDEFIDMLPEVHFIYLRTEPSIAKKRVLNRNRVGEESLTVDYLTDCHICHENWLNKQKNLTVIDACSEWDVKMPDIFNLGDNKNSKNIYL